MEFNGLRFWGFALLVVLFLPGCGADATNGHQTLREGLTTTDSSEILADNRKGSAEQPVQALQVLPAATDLVLPSHNIMENIARSDSLSTFMALLKKSDMVQKLNGTGPYTVFAPNDVALETRYGKGLKSMLKPENKEQLQALVSTHLLAGKLTIADLEDGATLITAGGQQLRVNKKNGQVRINDAVVAVPDATCRNGVLHTVDKVLEPVQKQQ